MIIVDLVNLLLNPLKGQLIRYPSKDLQRRMLLLKNNKINSILDVGANIGSYGKTMRKLGFTGRIVSVEPLSEVFQSLKRTARNDPNWETYNFALGDKDETSTINIAANKDSSSILEMLPKHINSAPQATYIGKENISIKKLDSIFHTLFDNDARVFLKIDTQGFEKQVLDGALLSLPKISGIQIEMSLVPLYKNALLYKEIIQYLETLGFKLQSLENGFANMNTGELLQVDGLFFR